MLAEIDKFQFRNAMSRLGAAVNVITTLGPTGPVGFAATAVCSVTDAPPTLLICLNQGSSVYSTVIASGVICVNTLKAEHQDIARIFGGKTPAEERFACGSWLSGLEGVPVLSDALLSLECRVDTWQDVGTHRVLFCGVQGIRMAEEGGGLIYFDRQFLAVG